MNRSLKAQDQGETKMLSETLEQVKGKLQRCSWDVMDEEQRDHVIRTVVVPRWGETTRDGVELKATKWAEILGTTEETVRGRYRRLRSRSEPISERPSTIELPTRRVRSDIKKPGVIEEVLKDPKAAKAVERAIAADPEAVTRIVEQRKSMGLPEPGPRPDPPKATDEERWLKWLNQLNATLMQGARLAEETDTAGLTGYAAMAFALYQRFSETQITAETKNLDDELRTLLGNR